MTDNTLARFARLRVPLGFAVGAVVLWLAQPTVRTLVVGSVIACLGEGLRIWAAGHINKSRELTTSGPYQWFGHPLYVGSAVMGIGMAVASNSLAVYLAIALYLGVTITVAVKAEEAFLRRKFGDEYDRYRGHTARRGLESAGPARRFDLEQAMRNREYRAVIGLVLVASLLLLKLL